MKTKKLLISFILILTVFSTQAQSGNGKIGSLLWKISGKDLKTPSYVLGTMHLKSGAYFDSIPGARAALQFSEQVIGELILDDMAAMQAQMSQAIIMNPDTTYNMLYSETDFQYVSSQLLPALGAGLDQLKTLKPAGIQLIITMIAYQKYFPGFNPNDALDAFIQTEAAKAKKTVLGLETVEDQIYALLGSSSLQAQADALLCELKNMDTSMVDLSDQIQAYDKGDLNQLYQSLYDKDAPCPASLEETNSLNKDRNDAWMKKIPALMKEKSTLIAVGALHLAGEEGLLNQLEKAGYRVEATK